MALTESTAELSFERQIELAWQGQLDFSSLIAAASGWEARGSTPLAIVLYQTWLARNPSPYEYIVQFNLGVALSNASDIAGAEAAYRRAIELAPGFVQPHLNLGTLLEHMEEAKAGVNRVFLDYWQLRISRHRDRHSTALAMRTYMSYSSTHEDETILEIIEGQRRGNNQESGQRWALSGEAKRQADDSAGTWRYRLFPGVSG